MKRTIVILAVVAMVVGILVLPAISAMTSMTLRESGYIECQPDDISTLIYAAGDHRHKINLTTTDVDFEPELTYKVRTYAHWGSSFGSWKLYNSTGYAYSSSGSYPYCR